MRRAVIALQAASLAFAIAPAAAAAPKPKTHTIVIDKMKFGAVPASVRVGDTILWVNRDMFRHTATARDKSFNMDLAPKESGRTKVTQAGAISFYCVYHPGMKGVLKAAK